MAVSFTSASGILAAIFLSLMRLVLNYILYLNLYLYPVYSLWIKDLVVLLCASKCALHKVWQTPTLYNHTQSMLLKCTLLKAVFEVLCTYCAIWKCLSTINITPDLLFLNIQNLFTNERISVYLDNHSRMSLDTKYYVVKQIRHLSKGVVIVASA